MDIVILRGVKAHELRSVFEALHFSEEPKTIPVVPVTPAPVSNGQRPEEAPRPEIVGEQPEVGKKRAEDSGGRCGDKHLFGK